MAFYQVFLRDGITGGVEVSDEGKIISASYPVLHKSVGLSFMRFSAWVKGRDGEMRLVKERPFKSGGEVHEVKRKGRYQGRSARGEAARVEAGS